MKTRTYGKKCKCGPFESQCTVDSFCPSLPKMPKLRIYLEPLLPKKSIAKRKDCKVCNCEQLDLKKTGWDF